MVFVVRMFVDRGRARNKHERIYFSPPFSARQCCVRRSQNRIAMIWMSRSLLSSVNFQLDNWHFWAAQSFDAPENYTQKLPERHEIPLSTFKKRRVEINLKRPKNFTFIFNSKFATRQSGRRYHLELELIWIDKYFHFRSASSPTTDANRTDA